MISIWNSFRRLVYDIDSLQGGNCSLRSPLGVKNRLKYAPRKNLCRRKEVYPEPPGSGLLHRISVGGFFNIIGL